MYKFLAISMLTGLISFPLAAEDMPPQEDICAKLVRLEALKQSELGKCRTAEKDPEFKRKSCNTRPDQGFCMVKFESEKNIVPITF